MNSGGSFLVDILMPAYNHGSFIEQAIQSVLSQECSFDYRLIIGEDASSDSTLDICMEFAEKEKHKVLLIKNSVNKGIGSNYKSLFLASTSKYIAILEGDDFWIDKHKLQKQVNILESNPDIGLVHTNYWSLFENGKRKKGHLWERAENNSGYVIGPQQIVKININPLTTCFRSDLVKDNVDFDFIIANNLLTVDIFLWAEICRRSHVHYIDEITGCYRIHPGSITGNKGIESIERFSKTSFLMVNYLMQKYDTPEEVKNAFISQNKIELIYQYILAGLPHKAQYELRGVKHTGSLRSKIICISARYRELNFICPMMNLIYHAGSMIKQFIGNRKNIGLYGLSRN